MPHQAETGENLRTTVRKIRETIDDIRERKGKIGEENTKAVLIEPIIAALGWNLEDLEEVSREYRHKSQDNPVDYALFLQRSPALLIEAKALERSLDEHKWISQAVGYANAAGVAWCVLTNGDEYRIYNAHAPVDVEKKLFREVHLTDTSQTEELLDTLELLSRSRVNRSEIEDIWEIQFTDTHVEEAVADAFESEDRKLVNAIKERTPELTPSQVRKSLRRANVIINFPTVTCVDEDTQDATASQDAEKSRATGRRVKLQDLLEAELIAPGDRWRLVAPQAGIEAYCEVTGDGHLLLDGERHGSPSAAGRAATGWKACHGWKHWEYRDDDGNWRQIDELREILNSESPGDVAAGDPEVQERLKGKPAAQAILAELLEQAGRAFGGFKVHANNKHIVLSNEYACAAISAQHRGLRMGLRLDPAEADRYSRLTRQPRDTFEGWSALHVSTVVTDPNQVDDELLRLMQKAYKDAQ